MRFSLSFLLAVFTVLIANGVAVYSQPVEGLPSYEQIVNLSFVYAEQLSVVFNREYIFPSIRFTHNGSIIGWRFVAVHNPGRALPSLSIFTPVSDNVYQRNSEIVALSECVIQQYPVTTSNGNYTVELHDSGPEQPVEFREGDVLVLHFRSPSTADFVPYMYNSTAATNDTSYYRPRPAPRLDNDFNIPSATSDTLLPLIALATCGRDANSTVSGVPLCTNTTLINTNGTCNLVPTMASPAATLAPHIIVISITVPVVLLLALAVIVLLALICFCVWSIRASKKKRHSLYAEEIGVEMNGLYSSTAGNPDYNYGGSLEDHTYDVVKESGPVAVNVYNNGHGPVANYEEPVLSASLDSVKHVYDKTAHSQGSTGSLAHSPPSTGYYHSLERPKVEPSAANCLTVARVYETPSPSGSPRPPHSSRTLPVDSRSANSVSPKPRHRLKSAPNKNQIPDETSHDSRPQSAEGLWDEFKSFRLETGVYVPTKKQISELSGSSRNLIFDDTIYSSLGKCVDSPRDNNWTFFNETEVYWRPGSSTATLYQQLASRHYREIIRKQIQIVSHLGSGEFGTVCKGVWQTEQGELDVAVKMCKAGEETTTLRFLQEAAIMGQFRHPNIVRLHGVITVGQPVMIVLELMSSDLRKYLKSLKSESSSQTTPPDLPSQLLDFSSQIALGMEYLARKEFVHRDLAARNILLTDDLVCKIADFGLSRDLQDEEYYVSNGGKIPIKWTAPEALQFRKYSTASDVWSFGCVMYEIWSLGHTPFQGTPTEEILALVESGHRLAPPPGCPGAIYQIMLDTWHPEPCERPSFTDVVKRLSQSEDILLSTGGEDATEVGVLGDGGEQLYSDSQVQYNSLVT